jgi:hypothetical protein
MSILTHRFVGSESLQPVVVVLMQTALVVVNEHRRRDVHRVAQSQPITTTLHGPCF